MLRIIGGGVGVEGSMCLTTQHQGSKLACRGGSRVAAGEILNLHLLCRYIGCLCFVIWVLYSSLWLDHGFYLPFFHVYLLALANGSQGESQLTDASN